MNCPKCSAPLKPTLTKSSVIIDVCTGCGGTWFDHGELNFFVKDRKALAQYYAQGLMDAKEVLQSCPKCSVNLHQGKLPGFRYEVEECPGCKGIFLDAHEFKKIGETVKFAGLARSVHKVALPSLEFASSLVLGSMYVLLFAVMTFMVHVGYITHKQGMLVVLSFIAFQFVCGPMLMDWSLRLWGSLHWVSFHELPEHLQKFITATSLKHKMPVPRIGIVNDNAPQAYTYGRTPKSARIVVTRGLLDSLTPEEIEAVIAHEFGHIVNWDFVLMTVAQIVPVLLYHIYRHCVNTSRNKPGTSRKSNKSFAAAAVVAYVAYVISDYLVKYFSRTREYWADKFSVDTTQNPNALVRALTKISYGITATQKPKDPAQVSVSSESKKMAIQSLGIMSVSGSKEFALYAAQGSQQDVKEIMQWDLWNPWAWFYELNSTHPLTAKRINMIGMHAKNLGQEPSVVFDIRRPESYWDDFFADCFIMLAPIIFALAFVAVKFRFNIPFSSIRFQDVVVPLTLGFSFGGIIKTMKAYPQDGFLDSSICSLLKKIKVSPVSTYPIKLRGTIIGRGVPGNIFSEDMLLRDKTGMIFLDYQQPIGLFNLIFALFRSKDYQGQDVMVEGWYRRAPMPYVEIKKVVSSLGSSTVQTYKFKMLFFMLLPLLAWFLSRTCR